MTDYGVCLMCGETIVSSDLLPVPISTLNGPRFTHRECSLREVLGGIGHQIAHEYWCLQRQDPNAGLTHRQSALMVWRLSELLGPDEVASRASDVRGVGEEKPLWKEGEPWRADDERDDAWGAEVLRWAESEDPPEWPPPTRTDPAPGSGAESA